MDVDELRECGFSTDAISRKARSGWLHRVHQGVYAVGTTNLSRDARFVAAVKACGPDAALGPLASAAYWNFLDRLEGDVDVFARHTRSRSRPGIRVRRSSLLQRRDLVERSGILVPKPTFTLAALAAIVHAGTLRRAIRRALSLQRTSLPDLLRMADRFGSSRGIRALRGVLAGDAVPTRSELEDTVLALILDAGFEQPDVNQSLTIEGRTVIPDFRWPAERLIVEADGAMWHDNPIARADDLRRQALLEAHGETVLRISWREAILERAAFVARLAAAGGPRRDDSSWRIAR